MQIKTTAVLLIFSFCWRCVELQSQTTTPSCVDGETISEDPDGCFGEICIDGQIAAWDHECVFSTPHCDGVQVKIPGQCCPECQSTTTPTTTLPPGCKVNGHLFPIGSRTNKDSCNPCTCTASGVKCENKSCDPITCVNPVRKRNNECCPKCAKGSNCWFGRKILEAGKKHKMSGTLVCWCPEPWRHSAVCSKTPPKQKLAKLLKKFGKFLASILSP